MPYTIELDVARKRIAILVAPPISEYDALKCFGEVRAHPDFRADYGILINLLAADRSLDVEEAEHLGGAMKYLFPGHRIALLRHTPTATPGLDAFRAAASSMTDVRIFTEMRAAEDWLADYGKP
jgi:hypothetical protein